MLIERINADIIGTVGIPADTQIENAPQHFVRVEFVQLRNSVPVLPQR
jgi:hypothetical protein